MNTLYYMLKAEVSTRKELTPAGNKVQIQTVLTLLGAHHILHVNGLRVKQI